MVAARLKHTLSETRSLIDTVMSTTATKREARKYIQKYAQFDASRESRRVCLIKLNYDDEETLPKIARAFSHLMTLGGNPVILMDSRPEIRGYLHGNLSFGAARNMLERRVLQFANLIDGKMGKTMPLQCPYNLNDPEPCSVIASIPTALASNRIPILPAFAYDDKTTQFSFMDGNEAMKILAEGLSSMKDVHVDKVVFVEPYGGIPSQQRQSSHVFINLCQEYSEIFAELINSDLPDEIKKQTIDDLTTMNTLLPPAHPTRTGIITTPKAAGNVVDKNPIIHNLLTDRPLISPSLPIKLQKTQLTTSLIRYGFPVKIITSEKGFNLLKQARAGKLNLARLVGLIERSFGRKLDLEHYLNRVKNNFAALIITGDYDGAAIITWERSSSGTPVAYLDKFAVDPQSQGSAGFADILLIKMVRQLFPKEVIWRSRSNNPVNKWYFERSRGFMKIPDSNWTMFWHSEDTNPPLKEYMDICSHIEPSLISN